MSAYIDRERLLKRIDKVIQHGAKDENGNHLISLEIVRDYVADMPTEWISIKDKMPKRRGNYIVCGKWGSGKHSVGEVEFCKDKGDEEGYFRTAWNFDVTHWMPLPQPPEIEDDKGKAYEE